MEYQIYPAADLFPMMDDKSFEAFKQSIAEEGQLETIKILDGKLIDGRNRLKACTELGVNPNFETVETDNPIGYIMATNVHRRHLPVAVRAEIAAKLANMKRGDPSAQRHSDTQNCASSISQTEAAELMGVSVRSVQTAKAKLNGKTDNVTPIKKEPKKVGWVNAVHKLVAHVITRENLSRRGNRGLRDDLESELGYEIPTMVTQEQVEEIAQKVLILVDVNEDEEARLKVELENYMEEAPETDKAKLEKMAKAQEVQQKRTFRQEVEVEAKKWLDDLLPSYSDEYRRYKRFNDAYKGVFSKTEYKRLLSCLHPDRVSDDLKEKFEDAFNLVKGKEELLCGSKQNDNPSSLPSTVADLMARRKVK